MKVNGADRFCVGQSIDKHLSKKFSNYSLKNFKNNKSVNRFKCNLKKNVNKTQAPGVMLEEIEEQKRQLPITGVRDKIIEAVKKAESIIFIGETACGKTTQLPQFLYQANFVLKNVTSENSSMIGVTQPRRVAAMSIAKRVADEMQVKLGTVVGYAVRFDEQTSPATKIKYLTDGILLREAISDPLLSQYKVIILDEAHERTIQTDVLFGVVKRAQKTRKQSQLPLLKVVVMSATMDVDHFSAYFDDAPVYYLPGRQHLIKMLYTCKPQTDYVHSALITVFQIHQNEPEGDILVFCTGQDEIEFMVRTVKDLLTQIPSEFQNLKPIPLYAALPSTTQMRIFNQAPKGWRKVIFSTNIAETSITIPKIKYVIDTGMVKERQFNSTTGLEILKVTRISKAQACQRAGRAGRESSGFCYRLYTKEEHESFRNFNIPDIQSCNLANVLLHLIAIKINDISNFEFMSKPSEDNIKWSLEELRKLGAIEFNSNSNFLTNHGKLMICFPVEPKFSKLIVTSMNFGCTEEIITLISLLSCDNIFYIPTTQREKANEIHKKFASTEGDLIKLLNVYRGFKEAKENLNWCQENFINIGNMKYAMEIRKQLTEICAKANIPKSSVGNNTEQLRRCLATGLALYSAVLQRDGSYKTKMTKQEVFIHPTSCLFGSKPECVIFIELIQTTKSYMRNISVVLENWINETLN